MFCMPGWIKLFEETFDERAGRLDERIGGRLKDSFVYKRNPVLKEFITWGVNSFTCIDEPELPDIFNNKARALLVQYFLFKKGLDSGCANYLQHVHPNCKTGSGWAAYQVPLCFEDDIDEKMIDILLTELNIDQLRRNKNLPAIPANRKHNYFNDDVYGTLGEPQNAKFITVPVNQKGHLIESQISMLAISLSKLGIDPEGLMPDIELAVYNDYINQYFLTHLLFGYHGQFTSLDTLEEIAGRTLNAGMSIMLPGEQFDDIHLILFDGEPGVSDGIAYINDALCKRMGPMYSSYGNIQFQYVDDEGQAFFLASPFSTLSEESISDGQTEKRIHKILRHAEDILRRNGEPNPFLLIAPEDAVRSEVVFPTISLENEDLDGIAITTMARLPAKTLLVSKHNYITPK